MNVQFMAFILALIAGMAACSKSNLVEKTVTFTFRVKDYETSLPGSHWIGTKDEKGLSHSGIPTTSKAAIEIDGLKDVIAKHPFVSSIDEKEGKTVMRKEEIISEINDYVKSIGDKLGKNKGYLCRIGELKIPNSESGAGEWKIDLSVDVPQTSSGNQLLVFSVIVFSFAMVLYV